MALFVWSRGKWPDVLVDAGRELYLPWRVSRGAVLYRDLAHLGGPLSVHLNALAFLVFGVGLRTLVGLDLVLLAGFTALLHGVLRRMASSLAARVGCAVFLGVFAFGQIGGIGNYQFVTPYAHEATHGLMLSVAALACLARHVRTGRERWLFGSALLAGLVFLTKAEVFLAALAGLAVGWGRVFRAARGGRARARVALLVGLGGLVAPLAAFVALASAMPARLALEGTLGTWPYVLAGRGTELVFYRAGLGADRPLANLRELATWTLGWLAALVPGAWAALAGARGRRATAALALAAAVVLGALRPYVDWLELARPLPVFALAFLALELVERRGRRRREPGARPDPDALLRASFAVFALVLLGKMLLNARVVHYGFVLALPATLLAVLLLVDRLPAALDRRGYAGSALRGWALGLILVAVAAHLLESQRWYAIKTHPVGSGSDAFLADERALAVVPALAELDRRLPPDGTLVALPEGVMLNYLLRRENPTRFNNFIPSEIAFFGEDALLAALRASPPDAIALVHRDTAEYGPRFFGRDYARGIAAWVEREYREVARFGAPPFAGDAFGIAILERRTNGREER